MYMVLDLETQIHAGFKRKANPFMEDNYIVARGWKVEGMDHAIATFYDSKDGVPEMMIPATVDVIVAHNAKFELLYEKRFSPDALHKFFKRGGRIWCTQLAEYLISGQQRKFHMNSLDQLAPLYGGRTKVDGVKDLWDQGIQTSDIDREMLKDYLIGTEEDGRNSGDIGNTELIYLGQLKAAEELGMLEAIKLRMDSLCSTSDMEFRGLKVDVEEAKRTLVALIKEEKDAKQELNSYLVDTPEGFDFNWNSNVHVSCILFGGTVKYSLRKPYIDEETGELARLKKKESWPLFSGKPVNPVDLEQNDAGLYIYEGVVQDVFKSGKKKGSGRTKQVDVPGELKIKYQEFFHTFSGYTTPDPSWKGSLTDARLGPVYSTGADTMDALAAQEDVPFVKALVEANRLTKEIGTYYFRKEEGKPAKGMLNCVQPQDHIIHHKLNHTSTVTSRLSASDPNAQNITRADYDASTGKYKSRAKAMFVSRFGKHGHMIEIDYSQLEVVVQAVLSNDAALIKALNNKLDMHCLRVSIAHDVSYEFALDACKNENHPEYALWSVRRTKAKIFSFQRAYGAGASLIALSTGMDVEEVKNLIEAEEKEFSGIVEFNADVQREVESTAEPFRDPERGFRAFRQGTYQAPTGCLYTFRSWDAPDFLRKKGITDTFKPTELKNYPVQGTGGEIVQMVLGYLWRYLVKKDFFDNRAYLVNTVHDCVWLDVHEDVVKDVVPAMKKIMQAVPAMLKKHFDITCPVQFPVDAEIGPNMLELKHYGDH